MPTYDYVCNDCSVEFEEFQSITSPPIERCPKCDGRVVRRIGAGNGLIFKGSGFYITDYKNSAKKGSDNGSPASGSEKAEKKATDSGKSDSPKIDS